jgi:hypothetical protein
MKISVFKSLYNANETPYNLDVLEVFDMIKNPNPSLKAQVDYLRSIYPSKEYDQKKKDLLAIQFNGTFTSRRITGLKEHSGLMIIDLDKMPTEKEYNETWQLLIECPYVFILFKSPSGLGIKGAVKIPVSNASEHKRRFEAYKKYINCEYWDDKNKDISRTCFYSCDENAHINLNALEFTDIEPEKGYKVSEAMPEIPITDEDEIIKRIEKFDFGGFVDGNRNEFIFKMACSFSEYGISEVTANSYFLKYIQSDFDEYEIKNIVKNSYRKAQHGTRVFENTKKKERANEMISKGYSAKIISEKLGIAEDTINDMKSENEDFETFWTTVEKRGKITITISPTLYTRFLERNGFAKFYPETTISSVFVRVIENKVNLVSETQIKDFVLEYLKEKKQFDVWDYCATSTGMFSDKYLSMLRSINLRMLSDTKDSAYIPFQNGVVKITSEGISLLRYIDVDGYIWNDQIIKRDFVKNDLYANDFEDFVSKVSAENLERTQALESTIGYLLHTYKDKTDQKAIIFNDQEIDDNPNGGSGKSLMLTALGYLRKSIKIDGKSFNPHKSDFVYQRVNIDTQILCFDDVKKNFDFEQLFSLITEGITVNRKNKDEIFIPFERSPKIVITTNYVIAGAGTSHDRRRHEIEFNQYFNNKRTPLNEYGRLLFDSWNIEDWIKFDNYMIKCLQIFLITGLRKPVSINTEAKKLIQSTCKDFYDWVMEGNLPDDIIYVGTCLNAFKEEYLTFKDLAPKVFSRWIQVYLEYKGIEYTKSRDARGVYIHIKKEKIDINAIMYGE